MPIVAYTHPSRAGLFTLQLVGQRWCIRLSDDAIEGRYSTAQQALDDLVGGHVRAPGGLDTAALGLPDTLDDWTALRA